MAGGRASLGLRLVGLVLLLAGLLSPLTASAHATLVNSSPEDGAVVVEAPKSFRLEFNEPVAVSSVRLSGGGQTIALDQVKTDGASVVIDAPFGLGTGSYALSYRVVSEDGHPIAGAVSFAIGAAGAGPAPEVDPADPGLDAAIWSIRLALYVGLLFGAGGAFALAWLADGDPQGRRAVALCSALGLIAAPLALALQGADLVGAPLGGAFDAIAWRQALATTYAWTIAAAAATLLLALLSLTCRGTLAMTLSAMALGGVGLSLAASGHASVAEPQMLMRSAVFVHTTAAAFWMGALAPLFLGLARGPSLGVRTLARFSAAAPYAVAALLAAGAIIAVRQTETVAALWTTDYGLVLTAKLTLVAALFALAMANRWLFTRPALEGSAAARRRLRLLVAVELVTGAVVLGVVALWRFTPPPRSLSAQAAQPTVAHLHTRAAQADIAITPGRVGKADMSIVMMTGDYGPLDAKQVAVVLSNPAAGVEAIRREARKSGDGIWRTDSVQLPAPGQWTVRVEILVTDFDLERLEGRIDVRP